MTHVERYLALNERLNQQKERRAVLAAKEEDKTRRRVALIEELKASGIDTAHPKEEILRLERETEAELSAAEERVNQFERELDAAEPGGTADYSHSVNLPAALVEEAFPLSVTNLTITEPTNESLLDDLEIS